LRRRLNLPRVAAEIAALDPPPRQPLVFPLVLSDQNSRRRVVAGYFVRFRFKRRLDAFYGGWHDDLKELRCGNGILRPPLRSEAVEKISLERCGGFCGVYCVEHRSLENPRKTVNSYGLPSTEDQDHGEFTFWWGRRFRFVSNSMVRSFGVGFR